MHNSDDAATDNAKKTGHLKLAFKYTPKTVCTHWVGSRKTYNNNSGLETHKNLITCNTTWYATNISK